MSQRAAPTAVPRQLSTIAHGIPAATAWLAGAYSFVAGLVTLAGWTFEVQRLTDWNNEGISMFPNTAVCAVLGGVALLLLAKRSGRRAVFAVRTAAATVATVSGLTLFEHFTNVNLGIDTLLFETTWGQRATVAPMRMGVPASTSFIIISTALLLATCGASARRTASGLAIAAVAIASLSLTGYWFGADQLFGVAQLTGIAWQTSTVIAALGIGLVAAVPEHGITAALLRNDAGGTVLRRLIVAILVFPLLLGWFRIAGQEAGYYDTAFGTAMRTLIEIIVFIGLVWWTANSISRHAMAAQVAETRLAAIIESSEDAIITKSLNGVIRSWNAGAERLFGHTAAEAIGQHISLVVPHDRIAEEDKILEKLRAGERIQHFESVRRRRDGQKVDVSLTISPIKNDAGQVIGASKIVRDITQQKKASRRLATQDAVTRALAESATLDAAAAKILPAIGEYLKWEVSGLWYVDPEGDVLRCSATWCSSLVEAHRFEAETRGHTFQSGIGLPGRVWASGKAAWIPDVATDGNFPRGPVAGEIGLHAAMGFPILLDDEVLGVVEFFSREVREPDDDLIQMMTAVGAQIGQFIERKNAEAALRESERRFKVLTSYAPVGIFQTDAEGNCLFVNARWCEMAGMTVEAARGKGWGKAVHPDDRERVLREWSDVAKSGQEFAGEYRFKRPDGEVTWLSGNAIALRAESGTILGFIGTITDITDQKRAEQSLVAADRRKDEFLATLAHELRNPLAPIRNALEIMQHAGRDGDVELVESARQIMQRQLAHLVRLVDDLLDVSRITRDKLELRKEQIELASIIDHATEACRPGIDEMRHELAVSLPQERIYLHADKVRMAQVFGNLINNACKYTQQRGRICVTAERSGNDVLVKVRDNGVGIAPEMLANVFEMFAQVGRSLEQSQGGLGIGLTLVKRLVAMHGGTIEAFSEGPGRGSEFQVRLPMLLEAPSARTLKPPVGSATHVRRRILIVDDNHDAAKSLAKLLEMNGNETSVAHDGAEAVNGAECFFPDVILLDIGLPKMNGYDACRSIRKRCGKEVVIIALTGWGQDEDRRRSKEAGFDNHLVKPVDPKTLMQLLAGLPQPVESG